MSPFCGESSCFSLGNSLKHRTRAEKGGTAAGGGELTLESIVLSVFEGWRPYPSIKGNRLLIEPLGYIYIYIYMVPPPPCLGFA